MGEFADKISPTSSIKSILDSYPFSVGIFRELLQNSDDAKATTQTFVLDKRTHTCAGLLNPDLAGTQGPALLAFNDAVFQEPDWEAIQTISNSSKKADTSKIGKYGLGFRSCYHVTDYPQILSGTQFAMFDPHRHIFPGGGIRLNFTERSADCASHLAAFQSCLSGVDASAELRGTVVRLPLRTASAAARSELSDREISFDLISQLLGEFAGNEIDIALLFLKNVSSIQVMEISDAGTVVLATAVVERDGSEVTCGMSGLDCCAFKKTVSVTGSLLANPRTTAWLIIDVSSSIDVAAIMAQRLGYDVRMFLRDRKLHPETGLAFPLPLDTLSSLNCGRLFTYLPLPIYTGFPCHVHALFALTPDRQHLVNPDETGLFGHQLLVHWNQLLFDTVLPHAWALAIVILQTHGHVQDVFRAWPSLRTAAGHGEFGPSRALISALIRITSASKMKIWPVARADPDRHSSALALGHVALSDVLVARPDVQQEVIDALATADVGISRVPGHLIDFLQDGAIGARFLTPASARAELLVKLEHLVVLDAATRSTILCYLLSESDLGEVLDLPLIPGVNGRYLSLSVSTSVAHVLLSDHDCTVFERFDAEAIPVGQLPACARTLLETCDARKFNVAKMTPHQVLTYLGKAVHEFGFDLYVKARSDISSAARDWLLSFFDWLVTSPLRAKIVSAPWMERARIFPCLGSTVRSFSDGIFDSSTLDRDTADVLHLLGVNFAHTSLSKDSLRVMSAKMLRTRDIPRLLELVQFHATDMLSHGQAEAVRQHLSAHLPSSKAKFSSRHASTLRQLPIFRVFDAFQPGGLRVAATSSVRLLAIPEGLTPIGATDGALLPVLKGHVFIQDADVPLVQYFSKGCALKRDDMILRLALAAFRDQTPDMQLAIIKRIRQSAASLPRVVLDELKGTLMVASRKFGTLLTPSVVVDPESRIAQLLLADDERWPDLSDPHNRALVDELRALAVLESRLSLQFVSERIEFIATSSHPVHVRHDLACRVISLLRSSGIDCSGLAVKPSLTWLPVRGGQLSTASTCFDPSVHRWELYDLVASALAEVPSESLRSALGWERPVPHEILLRQFSAVLSSSDPTGRSRRLDALLKELGKRMASLKATELEGLAHVVTGMPWIPISANSIVRTEHAVFTCDFPATSGLPFHEIPHNLTGREGVASLLEKMGCEERPSVSAMLTVLGSLPPKPERPKQAALILDALSDLSLSPELAAQILVPIAGGDMMPRDQVYFNDRGFSAFVLPPPGRFPAHISVKQDVAMRLGVTFRSTLQLQGLDDDDEEDMEEDLTTRIRGVLRQYTEDQAFLELFANAADAGATDMRLLLDEKIFPATSAHSSTMNRLQAQSSALIVHNNAIFKDEDFSGIRKIGRGGKEDSPNTIGKFGLGALSMFHFTDMATIVSNKTVLIMDPSKEYLTGDKRKRSIKLSLSQCRTMYPDILASLNGLFDFSASADLYQGTIFKLPLRNVNEVRGHSLSSVVRTASSVRDLIETSFWESAQQSLFFTGVTSISAFHRSADGILQALWAVSAERESTTTSHSMGTSETRMTVKSAIAKRERPTLAESTWHVWTERFGRDELPEDFAPLVQAHQLPIQFRIAIAAQIKNNNPLTHMRHRLYSTLPLPTPVALPAHIDCPFILAPDRRTIRYDDSGQHNPESKYNRWLLEKKAPSLFCNALATLPSERHWWPGASGSQLDPLARVVANAFYADFMPTSTLPMCLDVTGERIAPSDATFLGGEPIDMTAILKQVLRPAGLVKLPSGIASRVKRESIKMVDIDYVARAIRSKKEAMVLAFSSQFVTSRQISRIVKYLLREDVALVNADVSILYGLPLLPLLDGTLISFDRTSPVVYLNRYYVGTLFPANRFVDPGMGVHIDLPTLAKADINLYAFDKDAVLSLIRERIPENAEAHLNAADESWVAQLCIDLDILTSLNRALDISAFPLVRTSQQSRYISVQEALSNRVLASPPHDQWGLRAVFDSWDLPCVDIDHCPSSLRRLLQSKVFGLEVLLRCIKAQPLGESNIPSFFARLSQDLHIHLASWATRTFTMGPKLPAELLAMARSLPIWQPFQELGDVQYISASEVQMLPITIPLQSVAAFLALGLRTTTFIDHSSTLQRLEVTTLTVAQVRDACVVPRVVSAVTMPHFRRFLGVIIANRGQDDREPSVPNGRGVVVPVSTLFARSEPLFARSFASQPQQFVHQDLSDLEAGLIQFGLRSNMDPASFMECVLAVNAVAQATWLCQWYTDHLPLLINARNNSWRWSQFDDLHFIPAHQLRRRSVEWANDYARPLPALLSTSEVVRPALEAVAWSQRGRFADGPGDLVLLANPALGVPSAAEVVEHLRVLACRVAIDHSSLTIVLSDLTETYRWLQDNFREAGTLLLQFHDECLFLNVADPGSEPWVFRSADQLLYNVPDDDRGQVHAFLSPFKQLLLAAGANEIQRPSIPEISPSSAEAQQSSLRGAFNLLRTNRQLTDVLIIAGDGEGFPAHRDFLAANVEHFKDCFCGQLRESGPASVENPILFTVDEKYPSDCVKYTLDFLYCGTFPTRVDCQELVHMLYLSHEWGISDLHGEVQARIASSVNLSNHKELRDCAVELNATFLLEYLGSFVVLNRESLHRAAELARSEDLTS